MKTISLRSMSREELITQLHSFKKEAMNLRFRKASAELQNTARMRLVRKTVARINTALSEQASQIAKAVKNPL